MTLKVSNKKNENVTSSILIWASIFILPLSILLSFFTGSEVFSFSQDLHFSHKIDSTLAIIYLGTVPTGIAWLIRFTILKNNGLVFQAQVAYLIPIFGVILGYVFLNELITSKVIVALVSIIVGIYLVRLSNKKNITSI